jgi:hypothetical protein
MAARDAIVQMPPMGTKLVIVAAIAAFALE